MARARLRMNQIEPALQSYRDLIEHAPFARLTVARLLLIRNLGLPEERRDWAEVETHLRILALQYPRAGEVAILWAQVLSAQPKQAKARELLAEAEKEAPEQARLWVARAALEAARERGPKTALAVLDEGQARLGDSAELRLARIRYYVQSPPKEAANLLARL